MKKWDVPIEALSDSNIDLNDKDQAFQYMMPKETRELQAFYDEFQLFGQRLYDEIQRIISDNIPQQQQNLAQTLSFMKSLDTKASAENNEETS